VCARTLSRSYLAGLNERCVVSDGGHSDSGERERIQENSLDSLDWERTH
jgi:hypothetical protein